MYDGGAHCGKTIVITNTKTGTTRTGVIADECPTCDGSGCIDLSSGLFDQFASPEQGIFPGESHSPTVHDISFEIPLHNSFLVFSINDEHQSFIPLLFWLVTSAMSMTFILRFFPYSFLIFSMNPATHSLVLRFRFLFQ